MIDKKEKFCHTASCQELVCTRQEVVNLALGLTEKFRCLNCLATEFEPSNDACRLLLNLKDYISSRPCFAKEWQKYTSEKDCPSPKTCYPAQCFETEP